MTTYCAVTKRATPDGELFTNMLDGSQEFKPTGKPMIRDYKPGDEKKGKKGDR